MVRALICVMLFGAALSAQEVIPPGTILPVELNTSLRSDKMHSGEMVTGRIMQDVPLTRHTKIRAGTKIIGKVVDVTSGTREQIAVRFDTLKTRNRRIALTTDLRAMATAVDVEEAMIPTSGPDRGTSEADWVTEQIGGDTVYHGSVVTHGPEVVGNYVSGGVMVRVSAKPEDGCRGDVWGSRSSAGVVGFLVRCLWSVRLAQFEARARGQNGSDRRDTVAIYKRAS